MGAQVERARNKTRASLGIGRLFDTVRDAIVVAEVRSGTISLWNPAAARLFGWPADEVEGKPLETIIPPRFRERHRAGLARYRDTGHGNLIDNATPVLLPALRKDGSEIEIELMLSPLQSDEGRYVIAVIRDVTERQRREQDLRRANEDLEAFSYVVSHDLKEPVRALTYYLESLEEEHGKEMTAQTREMLERARHASDRLRAHLDRLLEYSRASRAELARTPLDIAELVRSDACQTLYAGLAVERRATVLVEPGGPHVVGNPGTLCQALGNLLANAIKHNPSSPPVVRVRVEREEDDGVILIQDNGAGFPWHVLRAFSDGGIVPGAGPRGGFGLAIARRAMERQGGRMSIENTPTGALVKLRLPAAH